VNLVDALKHEHRCRVQELSAAVRLTPSGLRRYKRAAGSGGHGEQRQRSLDLAAPVSHG
jgi:hypothetical protein